MALQVDHDTPNNYTMQFHFPDKKNPAGKVSPMAWSQGVPDQSDPVWMPQQSNPHLGWYVRYQWNGYAYL